MLRPHLSNTCSFSSMLEIWEEIMRNKATLELEINIQVTQHHPTNIPQTKTQSFFLMLCSCFKYDKEIMRKKPILELPNPPHTSFNTPSTCSSPLMPPIGLLLDYPPALSMGVALLARSSLHRPGTAARARSGSAPAYGEGEGWVRECERELERKRGRVGGRGDLGVEILGLFKNSLMGSLGEKEREKCF